MPSDLLSNTGIVELSQSPSIPCDLHTHSSRSMCGLHSYLEMIDFAQQKGMAGIAITDHGPDAGAVQPASVFFNYERFPEMYKNVRVWRGIEANFRINRSIDFVTENFDKYDLLLCGFHGTKAVPHTQRAISPEFPSLLMPSGENAAFYTDIILDILGNRAPGYFDILTHPTLKGYPLYIDEVVKACAKSGVAVEINNASFRYGKNDIDGSIAYIEAINEFKPRVVINSDAHTYHELGIYSDALAFLQNNPLDSSVPIVNATLKSTEQFVAERKALRQNNLC